MSNKKQRNKSTKKSLFKSRKKKKSEILTFVGFVLILTLCLCIFIMNSIETGSIDLPFTEDDDKVEIKLDNTEEDKIKVVDVNANTRNVAVMINNISTVWGYQSGIQDAHILYEIITEGGITRLMGIFNGTNTARIGTVRSARIYYLDYALENDAIYVHIGGSREALSDIRSLGVTDLESEVTWRDKSMGLAYEHTAFASMEKINARIASRGIRNTRNKDLLLNYSAKEIDLSTYEGAIPANNVNISFSNSKSTSFVYDAENKVYKRFQNNKAHTDYVTKAQYTAKNIITYQVKNSSYDSYGRQKLDNIGNGTGYYISNGYAVPITWEKKSRTEQTVYKYMNGEEIIVNDGNTHIEIQPKNRSLEIN